jgi:type II secretory ATPase GspE/PulE/Tfp pilus assembly ATPase PilB-like protein
MARYSEADEALGTALIEAALLNRAQLLYAMRRFEFATGSFAALLVRLGLVSDADMAQHMASARGLSFQERCLPGQPSTEALALCRREVCRSFGFLPLELSGGQLTAWLGDGSPDALREWLSRRFGLALLCIQGPMTGVAAAIEKAYGIDAESSHDLFDREVRRLEQDVQASLSTQPLVDAMIAWAVRDRATDIHLMPDANSLLVVFRIDGVLFPAAAMPRSLARLAAAIKVSAGMDIADNLRPQDGRFSFVLPGAALDIRVSTAVTPQGESVVMRLLPKGNFVRGLADLGFYAEHLPLFDRMFTQPYGVALIAGPTGSGKTTTLYAGLKPHGMSGKSILTVEDPVEYHLPAATQTQVNRKAGYQFDTAIRQFLRHDPDIMLVGEIRDRETAEAAMRAAETGHLVLSTLHVNSVFSVPARLQSMGISLVSMAETLVGIVTQRLLRRVCQQCRELDDSAGAGYPSRLRERLGDRPVYRAVGCPDCRGSGYLGRLPVYEILMVDEDVSRWIALGAGRHAMADGVLKPSNHVALLDTCVRRLLDGDTTLAEFQRVFGVIDERFAT